jgi:TIR domain
MVQATMPRSDPHALRFERSNGQLTVAREADLADSTGTQTGDPASARRGGRHHVRVHAFLSYNHSDKRTARRLGSQLKLVGADVWFDDWEVAAGDSIVGKVNEGLAMVDTLIVVWSANADRSQWVRAELETAIVRSLGEEHRFRVIPVRLDETVLPALLRPLKWVELNDDELGGGVGRVVNEIMGFANDQDRLRAIQEMLGESGLRVRYFEGAGSYVCCPGCGGDVDRLKGWMQTDYDRDSTYMGVKCEDCGFQEGGE